MERILVGVDGSAESRHALTWAADVAARSSAELVTARVFRSPQAELPPDEDRTLHEDERRELEELTAGAGVPARTELLDGDPAGALLEAALGERADLLAVGARGAGGLLNLHVGSVAHHLTHHTTLPLAIVPPGAEVPVTHVVVGVDGSADSLGAVAFSARLAATLGVGASAVYAFEPFVEWVPSNDPASVHRFAEEQAREWSAPFEQAGVDCDVTVDRDVHPVAALTRAVERHPGAVAVVGTRGLGGFAGLRLGRVPLQLVHHTGGAVVLVPAPTLT